MNRHLQRAIQAVAMPALLGIERLQTGVAFNPLDRKFRSDPYPLYRRAREKDPFHRSRLVQGWLLTRYEDVGAVLRDSAGFIVDDRKAPRFQKMREQAIRDGVIDPDEPLAESMLRSDPPDHTRMRSLVSKAFTPRAVEALRPRIEEIVEQQLDAVEQQGRMDIVRELGYPLPVTVIAEMLGIPTEDREQFKHWSDEIVRSIGMSSPEDGKASMQASRELRAYLEPIAQERRRSPREDLLSALLAAEADGDKLSIDEVFATVSLLLVAGNETTTNLIGNGMLALLRNPAQLAILRDDPSLIENAVEELLRYDSPVQFTTRRSPVDTRINGHAVKAWEEIVLGLGAANRDPEVFADPDRLDITRSDVRHLSFSHGIHFCLGAPLARLEGQIAINALARRFPSMQLAAEPEWRDNLILRGVQSLPVTL